MKSKDTLDQRHAGLWSRRFGADPSVIGRTVELSGNDSERRTVVGVMPAGFRDLEPDAEFWIPAVTDPETPGYFHGYGYQAIASLVPALRALRLAPPEALGAD